MQEFDVCVHVCMCACVCMSAYVCMCAYVRMYMHVHVCVCVCRCNGGPQQHEYKFELELFGEVNPSKSKMKKTDRHMEVILEKKDKSSHFWPRLTESKAKVHFVHTDFNLWKDEDDTSDEDDRMNDDFQSVRVTRTLRHTCVTCVSHVLHVT